MPLSDSPFPKGQLSTLWDAIVLQLTTDPILSGGVEEWQLWSGEAEDVMPVAFASLPAVRLTPSSGQFAWSDETSFGGTMILTFDIAIAGTRASDLMDFWECLSKPLTNNAYLSSTLIPLRCFSVVMTAPSIKPVTFAGRQGIEGSGVINLKLNVDSGDP